MHDEITAARRPGGFVVSLDFELWWGVRDRGSAGAAYRENLRGARRAIPGILALMKEFRVAATWASVGFLFAESRDELRRYLPAIRPEYRRAPLNPYEDFGDGTRAEDELRYAPDLLAQIADTPLQEIGSHTFSHFYCLEPGQTKEAFRADLEAAVALADRRGWKLRSLVFPRNQVNLSYLGVLRELDFVAYRGNEAGWMFDPRPEQRRRPWLRGARWLDNYVSSPQRGVTPWEELPAGDGLADIRGSLFLRPYSERWKELESMRLQRIARAIRRAARSGQMFHLWWHPHNFGRHIDENLNFLRRVFEVVSDCRERYQLRSLSMEQAALLPVNQEALRVTAA